jgi:Tfp pilus assembly protein PilF
VTGRQLFGTSVALAHRGDFVRAEQYLVAAMARDYPERAVVPMLMRVCIGASRLRAARGYAAHYLARYPDDWRVRFIAAVIALSLEDEAADSEFARVAADAPHFPDSHYYLGVVAYRRLVFDEARSHFRRYLALAPRGEHAAEAREAMARRPLRAVGAKGGSP